MYNHRYTRNKGILILARSIYFIRSKYLAMIWTFFKLLKPGFWLHTYNQSLSTFKKMSQSGQKDISEIQNFYNFR